MAQPAIRVMQLGKQYRLGVRARVHNSLGEVLKSALASPWRRVRQLGERGGDAELFWALREVSFEVRAGEVVGIIGSNGAGKSTLLKILARITEPTTGRAELRGTVGSLLEVGTGFHPELSGRENIYLNGAILGMPKAEIDRHFDAIVAFAEIDRFLDTAVKRYSSGMYVRLAFAVAAHLQPEILIVDEVLAVGDGAFQKKCLGTMRDVATSGRTVLFVSHNMAAVEGLCGRVLWLEGGRVQRDGPAAEVIDAYVAAQRESATADVAGRTDREGDGSARCTGLWLTDAQGQPVTMVRSGQDVELHLRYRLACADARYTFAVGIYDRMGTHLAHNSTEYGGCDFDRLAPEGELVCRMRRLPLPAGVYTVNVSIKRQGQRADRVQSAAAFTVENGDFYGSGRIPASISGKVLLDYDWTAAGMSAGRECAGVAAAGDAC